MTTFHIEASEADWFYENLWNYTHDITTLCATEALRFTQEDVAQKLGDLCRGLLMSLKVPKDEHTGLIPSVGTVIPGGFDSYMQAPPDHKLPLAL